MGERESKDGGTNWDVWRREYVLKRIIKTQFFHLIHTIRVLRVDNYGQITKKLDPLVQVRGVGAGGIVSTAYCLLYKLFTLRLTRKQLNGLINHPDSPYIRALGFMYIR